ncbi:MAG: orotidine-5'-phosphate decarboxylase [Verrucomicrobia bacterium]|nr:orotidine-5'-phosphate decarboxylase [Verrucomicrobiota bacterium]
MKSPLIVALDLPSAERAHELVGQIGDLVGAFKIGKELFVRAGPDLVRRIRDGGAPVFLDLKFHDIPNTVARAVAAAVQLGVRMLTVHASGGRAMLEAAENAARETAAQLKTEPPLVLGVTVLTSLDSDALAGIGMTANVARQVERLALLCVQAGLRGLVCSPLEVAALRQILPPDIQLVTPGIRDAGAPRDDQQRTLTAREAMAAGANWLVIGRPVYAAPDPRRATESILASL